MGENLLCPKQIATTPEFREGWDRVFNKFPFREYGYKVTVEKGRIRRMDETFGLSPVDVISKTPIPNMKGILENIQEPKEEK